MKGRKKTSSRNLMGQHRGGKQDSDMEYGSGVHRNANSGLGNRAYAGSNSVWSFLGQCQAASIAGLSL